MRQLQALIIGLHGCALENNVLWCLVNIAHEGHVAADPCSLEEAKAAAKVCSNRKHEGPLLSCWCVGIQANQENPVVQRLHSDGLTLPKVLIDLHS